MQRRQLMQATHTVNKIGGQQPAYLLFVYNTAYRVQLYAKEICQQCRLKRCVQFDLALSTPRMNQNNRKTFSMFRTNNVMSPFAKQVMSRLKEKLIPSYVNPTNPTNL